MTVWREFRSRVTTILLATAFVSSFIAGCASGGGQPGMDAALDALRDARRHLVAATSDKGGHRSRAIELVDQAIEEVQRGMRFDRRH